MSKKIYQEFTSANTIGVTLIHNGFQGGNHSKGGFVEIQIENLSDTSMQVNGKDSDKFSLVLKGDCERETLLCAFKMIVRELEQNKSIIDIDSDPFLPELPEIF